MLAFVALGSNLGDRERTLHEAVDLLRDEPGIEVVAVSGLLETEPWGYADQPRFVNAVCAVQTELAPRALLDLLLGLERRLGRVRGDGPRFGPRTIDLDLLLCDDLVVDEPGLTLPHPRMHERRFVLAPLAEIAPELEVPGRGRVVDLLAGVE
jgi:2-amino-4-hydroxy-6-hydroxymethyldihydropteridine diphosphokinase